MATASSPAANILFWDAYSYETEIFASSALERALVELGDRHKCDAYEMRTGRSPRMVIWDIALEIGRMRLLAFLCGHRFSGDELSPHRFVDATSFTVDSAALFDRAVHLGIAPSLVQLLSGLRSLPLLNEKLIIRGHDAVAILSIGLRHVLGAGPTMTHIESVLRLSFDDSHLSDTTIYSELREWERIRHPLSVLR